MNPENMKNTSSGKYDKIGGKSGENQCKLGENWGGKVI